MKQKPYIEVSTANGKVKIINAGEPNINYNTNQNGVTTSHGDNGQFVKDPNKPSLDATDYSWIEKNRHPDPNVQSSFVSSKPTPSTNQYFKTETQWQAPGRGTGLEYKVYQQDIDLNAQVAPGVTNAMLMKQGKAPFVMKNGKYEQVQLHHSRQDGRGSLFEVSESTHLHHTNQDGRLALHPFSTKHPDYPKLDNLYNKDQTQYWKDRLNMMQGN